MTNVRDRRARQAESHAAEMAKLKTEIAELKAEDERLRGEWLLLEQCRAARSFVDGARVGEDPRQSGLTRMSLVHLRERDAIASVGQGVNRLALLNPAVDVVRLRHVERVNRQRVASADGSATNDDQGSDSKRQVHG